ncbi:Mobile element protein [Fimbriiglobus ruber]|uniref:Mobile element protein n=2 Tax=Fimbriiglobus ruber TaxID=1908690 RepID=A0A225DRI4_9BACT|nr:Mobile element protein [Fimbriiglobus ruber]
MTAATFTAYVTQVLAKETRPGDVLILDNLSAHKTAGVQATLKACHISYLYLPPYSPDFNPIENAFSKLKRLVRTAAERTVEGLWKAIGKLLDRFPADECMRYLRHCGYPATIT